MQLQTEITLTNFPNVFFSGVNRTGSVSRTSRKNTMRKTEKDLSEIEFKMRMRQRRSSYVRFIPLDFVIEQDILSFSFILKNVPEIESTIEKPVRRGLCGYVTRVRFPAAIAHGSKISNSLQRISKPIDVTSLILKRNMVTLFIRKRQDFFLNSFSTLRFKKSFTEQSASP